MQAKPETQCAAFEGTKRIASGELRQVALKAKEAADRGSWAAILIFDSGTSQQIEVDFRGTPEEVLARLTDASADSSADSPRRPGRPRLGVVAREVTLLPRHWEWLNEQPGGASVALRKLVEQARRDLEGADRIRKTKETVYRFMSAMAGNEAGFEEASRALFAGNRERFQQETEQWPADIRDHARELATAAFPG